MTEPYNPPNVLSNYYGAWVRIPDTPVSSGDQVWLDLDGGIVVKAIYTSNSLQLGYALNPNLAGGAPGLTPIPQSSGGGGSGLDTVGDIGSINFAPTDYFVWGITGAGDKYSFETWNGGDSMVTFKITQMLDGRAPLVPTYVIGFEDGTDQDYQDFVAEVSNVAPVPVPAAVVLGAIGLGLVGWVKRRTK